MKHYGDVSKISGSQIEPVDIITFGSPCSDLSVAGKREGMKHAEQGAKTLGSLFDGSGGFPLAGMLNGIMPVWASEVEPYPIAVTKSRFKEKQE